MTIVRPPTGALNTLARTSPSRLAFVCGALLWLVQTDCRAPTPMPGAEGVREIEAAKPIQAQIAAEAHTYSVRLQAGRSVRVLVDQRDTDLALIVAPPDGRPLLAADARERGVESVTILADASGVFTIDVRAVRPSKGSGTAYEVRLEAPAHATTSRERLQRRVESLATGMRS